MAARACRRNCGFGAAPKCSSKGNCEKKRVKWLPIHMQLCPSPLTRTQTNKANKVHKSGLTYNGVQRPTKDIIIQSVVQVLAQVGEGRKCCFNDQHGICGSSSSATNKQRDKGVLNIATANYESSSAQKSRKLTVALSSLAFEPRKGTNPPIPPGQFGCGRSCTPNSWMCA